MIRDAAEMDLDDEYIDKVVPEDQLQDLQEENAQERDSFLARIQKMEQQCYQLNERLQVQQQQHQQLLNAMKQQPQQHALQPQQQALQPLPNLEVQREAGPVRRIRPRAGRSVRRWRERQDAIKTRKLVALLHKMADSSRWNCCCCWSCSRSFSFWNCCSIFCTLTRKKLFLKSSFANL